MIIAFVLIILLWLLAFEGVCHWFQLADRIQTSSDRVKIVAAGGYKLKYCPINFMIHHRYQNPFSMYKLDRLYPFPASSLPLIPSSLIMFFFLSIFHSLLSFIFLSFFFPPAFQVPFFLSFPFSSCLPLFRSYFLSFVLSFFLSFLLTYFISVFLSFFRFFFLYFILTVSFKTLIKTKTPLIIVSKVDPVIHITHAI